jgi:group I intron endonuclease
MKTYLKKGKSAIYSSIINNGIHNFKLEILEYCSPAKCIKREQHYLDLLQPEYNILKNAGSRLGSNQSEESRAKISAAAKKIDHPGRFKTGENNPMFGITGEKHHRFGKPRVEGAGRPSQQIEVFDLQEKTTTSYNSKSAAARALNISLSVIGMYFLRNQTKPYKGRYTFKKL